VAGIPTGSIKWLKVAEILQGEHTGCMEDSLKVWAFALPEIDPSGFVCGVKIPRRKLVGNDAGEETM
jgi:hypothetical protein